jgi:hypothetical protein
MESVAPPGGVMLSESTARLVEALQTAAGSNNDFVRSLAEYTLGVVLLDRDAAADRRRGLELMAEVPDMCLRGSVLYPVPATEMSAARERARSGDCDAAYR